jgi:hypothetical protein
LSNNTSLLSKIKTVWHETFIGKTGIVALSNAEFHTIEFGFYPEITLLKGKTHVYLVALLHYD